MKILVSSFHNPHYLTVTEYVENAVEGLGHLLIKFDDRQHFIPGRIRNFIKVFNQVDLYRINRKLLGLVAAYSPDLAIVLGGHRVQPATIRKLKNSGTICALWTTDAPLVFDPILTVAPEYDFIFCQGTEAIEVLAGAGINNSNWLPVGCDPYYHRPVDLKQEDKDSYGSDIVFVGSYYPNRWKILKELFEFNFKIWGPGWNRVCGNQEMAANICDTNLDYNRWVKIFNAAKIVIVSHFQDGVTPCYQASPKVFEALGCKSFVLVDGQKDVFKLFKNGVHLVSFREVSDLKNKIRYYLENENERKTIAHQGHIEAKRNHKYSNRIKELLNVIRKR